MKITYYAAVSLDGYIATLDRDISWLSEVDIEVADTGYDEFYASVDGLMMGRYTYDVLLNYGSWPYADKPAWLLTQRKIEMPKDADLTMVSNVDDFLEQAKAAKLHHIWLVGGGQLASSLLDKGLLTHLSVSQMPVTLGSGIALFAHHKMQQLETIKTQISQKNGFKQIETVLRGKIGS